MFLYFFNLCNNKNTCELELAINGKVTENHAVQFLSILPLRMCSIFIFWLTYKRPLLTHNFCFLFSLQGPWSTSGLPFMSAPIPHFWLIQPLFFKIGPLLFLRGDSRGLFWLVPTPWPVWWLKGLETKPWTKICSQELPSTRVKWKSPLPRPCVIAVQMGFIQIIV